MIEMKKIFLLLATALMAAGFTACSDNDDPKGGDSGETTSGIYIINSGNQRANIAPSITRYDYLSGATSPALQDAFQAANGVMIGDGLQQATICNGKMYIAMYNSNLIWVVEPSTLKIITRIVPDGDAKTPRFMTSKDGMIYCSMFTGYVCEIDTKTDKITRTLKVGPNPEKMAIAGNTLYVACSDGNNYDGAASNGVKYGNSYIAKVDLKTFTETKVTGLEEAVGAVQAASLNPTEVVSNGSDVFVVSMGDYDLEKTKNTVIRISGDKVSKVCDGSMIAIDDNDLYVIYAQYGGGDPTYRKYDAGTLEEKGSFINQSGSTEAVVEYPGGVNADPVSGDIVVLSYTLSEAGYAQYKEPCYANLYSKDGSFKKRIACGVGAISATFVHTTK